MPSAEASGAICVQRFDGSRNSAIHTTYRISLRSSSIREPRYPLLRVVFGLCGADRPPPLFASEWFCVWGGLSWIQITSVTSRRGQSPTPERRPPDLKLRLVSPSQGTDARRGPPKGRPSHTGGTNGYQGGFDRFNDPSAGSPTETLLRLLLPLGGRV